jgi:hypothetical protein
MSTWGADLMPVAHAIGAHCAAEAKATSLTSIVAAKDRAEGLQKRGVAVESVLGTFKDEFVKTAQQAANAASRGLAGTRARIFVNRVAVWLKFCHNRAKARTFKQKTPEMPKLDNVGATTKVLDSDSEDEEDDDNAGEDNNDAGNNHDTDEDEEQEEEEDDNDDDAGEEEGNDDDDTGEDDGDASAGKNFAAKARKRKATGNIAQIVPKRRNTWAAPDKRFGRDSSGDNKDAVHSSSDKEDAAHGGSSNKDDERDAHKAKSVPGAIQQPAAIVRVPEARRFTSWAFFKRVDGITSEFGPVPCKDCPCGHCCCVFAALESAAMLYARNWPLAKHHKSVERRASSTLGCGYGVFAVKAIPAGTILDAQYTGALSDLSPKDKWHAGHPYEVQDTKSKTQRIGFPCSIWSYANSARNEDGTTPNIQLNQDMQFIALRDIKKGEELLWAYSGTYFKDLSSDEDNKLRDHLSVKTRIPAHVFANLVKHSTCVKRGCA